MRSVTISAILLAVSAITGCATSAGGDDDDNGKTDGDGITVGRYVVNEKFNTMKTGVRPRSTWFSTGSVAVREVPFAADKSVEIAKSAGGAAASLERDFSPQHGRVVVEAKVLARETAGFKAAPYIYDTTNSAFASIAFHDGNIEMHVGATTTTVMPFVANEWYRVRVVIDTDSDTFDLFVDGVRKAQRQALRRATDSVSRVRWYLDSDPGTLLVDNVRIYTESVYIGPAPKPVFDPRTYGATGDGTTNDTLAIQYAIDDAANSGGSVVLADGTFLSGSLTLHGGMTFFIDSSAVLLGSKNIADYPALAPHTGNTQLSNCKRALLYATEVANVTIDGGGTIDGQGDAFPNSDPEGMRPMLIWSVLAQHLTVRNLYLKKGAVWSLVSMESDHVIIDNVNVQSDNITHDGIDIVDGSDIVVENVAVRSGDDAMCLKNGIKFGTATYGAFKHITIQDSYVKDVQYAAMAVESRQGSDIDGVAFHRIEFANAGAAFFVYLAQQTTTHPIGDVPKLGSITNVSFTDIAGSTASWPHSPHQGSLITGHLFNGTTYPITNLQLTNVAIRFDGGLSTVPTAPIEAKENQYPESNMFGDLPAWAFYLRHVQGATFTNVTSTVASPDARQPVVTDDSTGL
jgi:polygalacturonase